MNTETSNLQTGDMVIDASCSECARRESGELDLKYPGGDLLDIQLVPTFPLSRRMRMISVQDTDGNELALIADASEFDGDSRRAVKEELDRSYFMPIVTDIKHAEEKLGVLTLETETDHGPRTAQIRNARRSIRKLSHNRVLIRDVDSNRYEVRDWTQLPAYGRDLLAQYM